jgi:hypothetical protein
MAPFTPMSDSGAGTSNSRPPELHEEPASLHSWPCMLSLSRSSLYYSVLAWAARWRPLSQDALRRSTVPLCRQSSTVAGGPLLRLRGSSCPASRLAHRVGRCVPLLSTTMRRQRRGRSRLRAGSPATGAGSTCCRGGHSGRRGATATRACPPPPRAPGPAR